MFSYSFMRIAFFICIFISIMLPLLGAPLVQKRLSMTGDALSHTSLLGVAIGIVAGFNPLIASIIISIVASVVIELIRRKFSKYAELSVVIVMSFAIGLTAILSKYSSAATFSSYLFGSISLVTLKDLIVIIAVAIVTVIFSIGFYRQILYSSYNEFQASLDNIHVKALNMAQTILTAIIVAISSKVVGALIVSALMVIPYASSIQLIKSYKGSLIVSIVLSLIASIIGVIASYYLDISAGGVMVVTSTIILLVSLIINKILKLSK
ncbi:MAG: metal ABC transporter permease [Acholeplasmatales bacterium]|nr:metal ABC transporter permease [Acholeplasmatales bacterium]